MSLSDSTPLEVAIAASIASRTLAILPTKARNEALTSMHNVLQEAKENILEANAQDLKEAAEAAADGRLSQSVLGRLDLARKGKWEDMLQGILSVRDLQDPGETSHELEVHAWMLNDRAKGGKESTASFIAISTAISNALRSTAVPNASIQLLTTRDIIPDLLQQDKYIDLVIPRGSNDLVRYIKSNTRIPVLGHADGLCSIYIAEDAEKEMCVKVIVDAKTSYPSACNAVETLLIDHAALNTIFPAVAEALLEKGVSLRCDVSSLAALTAVLPHRLATLLQSSTEEDYNTEFLSLTLAVKSLPPCGDALSSLDAAVNHINTHSSSHTDAILTSSATLAHRFQAAVDSACVFWNTSTRMADGMRFGFGTEVGISTNKIHARGPVGLDGLMIYKTLISGEGQISAEYGSGIGQKTWKHEKLAIQIDSCTENSSNQV
ncbi:hypothetical protein MMC13_006556 [Lambiella insularis]|nr:hypothetical protein [Lambiella insularis]